jgi:type I restriction enzyme S subunit
MNVESFFGAFERLIDEPIAVVKVRELVLQLAVQGKLVEQSEADGTAEAVFAEIARTTTLGSSGNWSEYEPDETPIGSLPENWRWAPTSALCDLQTGKRMAGGAQESGVISLGGEHLNTDGTIDYTVPRYVSLDFFNEMRAGRVAMHDTLMVKDGATTGKTAFVAALPADGRAAVNEHVFILRWHEPIVKQLAFYFIRAFAFTHIATKSVGLIGGIRRDVVLDFPFPVPPLAEQRRIVAKVNELMASCDRLEVQLRDREAQRVLLARASVARLVQAPSTANLKLLFSDSYSVDPSDIRRAILQLAFAGKLIPQDSEDEPAAVLLKKARAEKARLIADGSVKREPWADDLHPPSSLYELPPGWEWAHVSELVEKVTVGFVGSMVKHYREKGVPFLRSQNVRENRFDPLGLTFISEEFHRSIIKSVLRPGDVVVTRSGSVGVTCVIPEDLREANCSDLVIIKRPLALVSQFLSYFINSVAAGQIEAKTVGIALTHFNTRSVAQMTVPLPPLAEQHRIVKKVENLMGLSSELEMRLATSQTSARKVLGAIVTELTVEA